VAQGSNGSVVQRNYYFPYGKVNGNESWNTSFQPYKFSGNEHETMHGLKLHDFHARQLGEVIPAFTTMDPLSENDYATSPYAYCGNDPINRIDPWGLDWYWNVGGIDDMKWFEGDKDRKGFRYHSATVECMDEEYWYYYRENGKIDKEKREPVVIWGHKYSNGGAGLLPENNIGNPWDTGNNGYGDGGYGGISPAWGNAVNGIGKHIVGPALILSGRKIEALKPVGALGSPKGSSVASYTLSKVFPQRFTNVFGRRIGTKIVDIAGTNVIGRFAGRLVPYAGWGLTTYDIYTTGTELLQETELMQQIIWTHIQSELESSQANYFNVNYYNYY
jgi:RHS repeat-associated protein